MITGKNEKNTFLSKKIVNFKKMKKIETFLSAKPVAELALLSWGKNYCGLKITLGMFSLLVKDVANIWRQRKDNL